MDDFFDNGGADLLSSLASDATSAYTTEAELNSNPLNTALVVGGTATTAQGTTASLAPATLGGSSGLILLIVAVLAIFFVTRS
jgi:hypothetical protein